jgi:hypothetical protein
LSFLFAVTTTLLLPNGVVLTLCIPIPMMSVAGLLPEIPSIGDAD